MVNETGTLQEVHLERVRPWLDVIDALRADGVQQDLPLPQIAVMGDQSSGKSSVLEAISGVPFPRGSGLTTRCPIQLMMKRAPKGSMWSAHASVAWSDKRMEQPDGTGAVASPDELADIITQLSSTVTAGQASGFASDSIVIRIVSPDVPDLTLIDLPGIVRTTTKGQSVSAIAEVNALITRYINQERTVILAVVPANQDVATVDILERARQVDPDGERTLGVLTKPDLVDEGGEGEVVEVLTNRRAPLRLGYVMVKNRSQRDVDQGVKLQQGREDEAAFFAEHPQLHALPPHLLGTANLMDRLTRLLVTRIETALPGIRWELQNQLDTVERELIPLGKALPLTATERQHGLMKIVSDYCRVIRQAVRGDYRDPIMTTNPKLRIYGETHALFGAMQGSIARTGEIFSDPNFADKVLAQMSVMKGREFPGFLNSQIFYGFMVQNVETWRPAVEVCRVQLVACLRGICTEVISCVAPHLPRLREAVSAMVADVVERFGDDLTLRLEELFAKESDPYTSNEYMLVVMNQIRCQKFGDAVDEALKASGPKPESMESLKNDVKKRLGDWYMRHHGVNPASTVADMCVLLKAYWQVATKRLVDNVCMTCEKDFIEKAIVEIESECFTLGSAFDGGPTLAELFEEDQGILAKRLALLAKKERLARALSTLRNMEPTMTGRSSTGPMSD